MSPMSREAFAENGARIAQWDINRTEPVLSSLPAPLPLLAIQSIYHDRDTPGSSLRSHEKSTPFTTSSHPQPSQPASRPSSKSSF